MEETVTITKAEYELLTAMEDVLKNAEATIEELSKTNTKYAGIIDELTLKMESLETQLKTKTIKVEKETVTMTNYKLDINSFKEVAPRETKENKVVTTEAIEELDVNNFLKINVKSVEVSKNLNNKVRTVAPKVIVKTANATHSGIDAVAKAAHVTTNVVAKATNTAIAKTANGVDAILDVVAPTVDRVDASHIRRTFNDIQNGDVMEVAGRTYQRINGKFEAVK